MYWKEGNGVASFTTEIVESMIEEQKKFFFTGLTKKIDFRKK